LSSWEDVTYESSYHYKEKEDDPDISCFFVKIGAVIQASADVEVDTDEKEGCTVCMEISDESPEVNISTDVGYGGKG